MKTYVLANRLIIAEKRTRDRFRADLGKLSRPVIPKVGFEAHWKVSTVLRGRQQSVSI